MFLKNFFEMRLRHSEPSANHIPLRHSERSEGSQHF